MTMPKKDKSTPKPWYEVKAAGDDSAELLIYGNIGPSYWDDESVTAKQLIAELKDVDGKDLTVRINSVGGSVADGIAIFNALRRHSGAVTVEIDAVAYSAASLIAMAGETVIMADNGLLMIHAPMSWASGNAQQMRKQADILDKYADAMTNAYIRDGGPDKADIEGWLKDGDDHYFTASEALDLGLIDDTTDSVDIAACADGIDFRNFKSPTLAAMPAATLPTSRKDKTMPEKKTPKAGAEPTAEEKPVNFTEIEAAANAKQVEAIRARNTEVLAIITPHMQVNGMSELKDQILADPEITVDAAREKILDVIGKQHEPLAAAGGVRVDVVTDERDKRIEAAGNIILARAKIKSEEGKAIQMAGNPYRGMSLMDLARECLASCGYDTRGKTKMEVVAAAFTQSTSDFPVLLENAMHKALLSGYRTAADTWSRFCAVGSVSDFRAHNRYMIGSLGNLDDLTELGEFQNKQIGDGSKETVSIGTKGNLINISRQAIINDDLGAFVGLASALGRAARRTIESTVYSTLALNSGMGPTLSDGKSLFHADHGNLAATAGGPSVATVESCVLAMAGQKDISGNDYLDLTPAIWLGPKSLELTARVLNASTNDPDAPAKSKNDNVPNPYQNYFSDLVGTPRLTGNPWFVFASPDEAPVLEVSFLDGEQEPFLDMQDGWSVDGTQYKARLDFGVSGVGYAGAVRNAGA